MRLTGMHEAEADPDGHTVVNERPNNDTDEQEEGRLSCDNNDTEGVEEAIEMRE